MHCKTDSGTHADNSLLDNTTIILFWIMHLLGALSKTDRPDRTNLCMRYVK